MNFASYFGDARKCNDKINRLDTRQLVHLFSRLCTKIQRTWSECQFIVIPRNDVQLIQR